MSEFVLDASAVLAYFSDEPGSEVVEDLVGAGALMSAVNWAEVVGKLVGRGSTDDDTRELLANLELTVIPFDSDAAWEAGRLIRVTEPYGLSLGDRACLGLAQARRCPVATADRVWANIRLEHVEIRLIRV